MSTTYSTKPGDTFARVARIVYGDETQASRISVANPGAVGPFPGGVVLTIPGGGRQPARQQQGSGDPDEVAVYIDGRRFRYWDGASITRSVDAPDTIDVSAPFEPDAPGFREAFRPLSFRPLEVTVGGDRLFTGTMVGVSPTLGPDARTVAISGYSTPGVLQDCTPPSSAYPLEFNGQNLKAIAERVAGFFGVSVEFDGDPGPAFERVACEPGKTAHAFLSDLARLRGFVMASTETGALLVHRPAGSAAVATLQQGLSPLVSVVPQISPQEIYSDVTGVEPVEVGTDGETHTVPIPHMRGVVRPHSYTVEDGEGGDIRASVAAKAGRMYGAALSYEAAVSTWRDQSGDLWRPGASVDLIAPGAMIYNRYRFIIRAVTFSAQADRTAALTLTLPGAFTGTLPEALPWD